MNTIIFDGAKFANEKLKHLKESVLNLNKPLKLVSIVHQEDIIGQTYTKLKQEACKQVKINFEKIEVSFKDSPNQVINVIRNTSNDSSVNGLLIQKPSKATWKKYYHSKLSFFDWWEQYTNQINPAKDVDCLTRTNLNAVYEDKSDFLPATAQAVLEVLRLALKKDSLDNDWGDQVICIVGKSELAGKPLAEKFFQWGAKTYLLGSQDNLEEFLPRSDIIISATGVKHLITADLIKEGALLIDLGEPDPDIDIESIKNIASFVTPVPGGIGPITVVSLLDNLLNI
jgi:methylenetetrahydrofolate dehydrogenase (NADP+)/methenyltetrahydrofolate cyclohydrolase